MSRPRVHSSQALPFSRVPPCLPPTPYILLPPTPYIPLSPVSSSPMPYIPLSLLSPRPRWREPAPFSQDKNTISYSRAHTHAHTYTHTHTHTHTHTCILGRRKRRQRTTTSTVTHKYYILRTNIIFYAQILYFLYMYIRPEEATAKDYYFDIYAHLSAFFFSLHFFCFFY